MSVILEFTIRSESFTLGQILSGTAGMRSEIERICPMGSEAIPFVWTTGKNHTEFEERVRNRPEVNELLTLDTVGESRLYRLDWEETPTSLIDAIVASEATVLEARESENWLFRLRFVGPDTLSQFHNYCTDHGLVISIDRTHTLKEKTEWRCGSGLSQEQYEALVLALKRGYFATPSEVSLEELAAELGITKQAFSKRIRRGNETVLRNALP